VVVEHRQRRATAALQGREIALEVHLPQRIRVRVFETLPMLALCGITLVDQPVTAQNLCNGGRCRRKRCASTV
jgi:hypothetical protein